MIFKRTSLRKQHPKRPLSWFSSVNIICEMVKLIHHRKKIEIYLQLLVCILPTTTSSFHKNIFAIHKIWKRNILNGLTMFWSYVVMKQIFRIEANSILFRNSLVCVMKLRNTVEIHIIHDNSIRLHGKK